MSISQRERIPKKDALLRTADEVEEGSVEHLLGLCLRGPVDHLGGQSCHKRLIDRLMERLEQSDAGDKNALLDIHRSAYSVYEMLIGHPFSPAAIHERSLWLNQFRLLYEEAILFRDLRQVATALPDERTSKSRSGLKAWFLAQAKKRSMLDLAVENFLEHQASIEQFERFIIADGYLNFRFFDAIVLAQLHFMESVKVKISHHIWDEVGLGNGHAAHTVKFANSLKRLQVQLPTLPPWEDWRPYAGFNLYFVLGCNRRHLFRALGSLAMPELFDVDRDEFVVRGMKRLGFDPGNDFQFFVAHIEQDSEHGPDWLEGVVLPVLMAEPSAGKELAEGAALRMLAMRRYNEYLADCVFDLGCNESSGDARLGAPM